MRTCFIYARVSSKEQADEGFSIPAQVELLKRYAAKNNIRVVDVYSEAETAKQSGRAEFQKMLKDLKQKNAPKVVLVEKTDPLYRNFKDYVEIEDLMKERNLEIHLVKENEVLSDRSPSHTKFIHSIKVVVSKNFIDNLREEVVKGQRQKVKEGGWITQAPYGYFNNKGEIFPHPEKKKFVIAAYNLYSEGIHSLGSCADELFSRAIFYNPSMPKISRQLLQKMLTNPAYAGLIRYNGELFEGKHEPIISMELFKKVQSELGVKCKNKIRSSRVLAYRGLITCEECGNHLIGDIKKGGKYIYYRCNKIGSKCSQGYISSTKIDEAIQSALSELTVPPDLKVWLKESIEDSLELHQDSLQDEMATISREVSKIGSNLKKAYHDKLNSVISHEDFLEFQSEQFERRALLEERMAKLTEADHDYYHTLNTLIELPELMTSKWMQATDEQKGSLLKILLSNFSVQGQKIILELNPVFDCLRKLPKIRDGATKVTVLEIMKSYRVSIEDYKTRLVA